MESDEPVENNGEGNRANIVANSMEENFSGAGGGGYGGNFATEDRVDMVDSGDEHTESREEGELCSDSDEDYRETGSTSKFANCNAATQLDTVQVAPLNKMTHDVKLEICNAVNKSSSMVDVSSSAYPPLDHHKDSDKNRGEFVPFVIRFSDDESGSDSDNSRSKTSESKDDTHGTDESKRPPPCSLRKSPKLQKSTVKEGRVMPRHMSVDCLGISSDVKTSGALRNVGQISSIQSLNYQKTRAGKDQKWRTNLDLSAAKMQDLRQLIEIRENQMKLKTAQQTKSSYTGFQRDNIARNLNNSASIPDKTAQVHDFQSNLNSPDKKRLKTGEPQFRKLCLDCLKSVGDPLLLEKSTLDNQDKLNIEGRCYCGKDNTQKTSHASHLEEQKQNARHFQLTSANSLTEKGGPWLVANNLLENTNDGIANTIFSPAQIGQTGEGPARDFPMKIDPSNYASFLNCLDKPSMNKTSKLDMASMLHYEDILDKELEAAQEHRQNCEIDERNALTAYRKAQRALVEANARCSNLYSQRELYSAQLRSLMMENPNQFFTSRPSDHTEARLSVSNKISDVDVHIIPTSSHCKKAPFDISARRALHSKIAPPGSAFQNQSHLHVEGQLVSDPCGKPARSSLEAHRLEDVSNGVCCSSDDLNQSANEDDVICQLKPTSVQDNLEYAQTSECDGGRDKDRNNGLLGQLSVDSPQDSLLLEASLRSQLYEKLRAKKLFKSGIHENTGSANERIGGDDDGGKIIGVIENAPPFEAEIDKNSDFERRNMGEGISELPVQFSSDTDMIPSDNASPSVGDPINDHFLPEGLELTISSTPLCPNMRSAFIHLKITKPVATLQSETTSSDILSSDINEKGGDTDICPENQTIMLSKDMPEMATLSFCDGKSGHYSCNLAIDPLRPLCMFDLRGKCNNDECSWQHIKDYTCDSMQRDTIDDTDCQVQKELQREEFSNTSNLSKSLDHLALAPPTYLVASDVLWANSQSYASLLAEDYGKCWQTRFSNFLVLSSLFPRASRSNEPFLHGSEARIEVQSDWSRQSSYFHSRNSRLIDQPSADIEQSLETALLNFSKEANKQKGRVEALKVLVPAIEANPRSAVLWMVYLQIFYFNQKSIGKDDLFKWAVEFNLESYELWLIYINSREHLEDRLAAYDAALSALSHHVSAANCDASCASQCILDIFLQMLDFMCRSGNVGNAIEKISGLTISSKKTDEPCQSTLHDVISCLTNCDKFVFWMSCVYLVVYKKLPNPVVHSFECWKESSTIEWPDVNLTSDQKQQAALLMEMAVDSLVSYMDSESLENEKTLRAAYLFALNHVRCVSVLEGLTCSRLLLEKYIKLYPSCLELVLMAARVEYHTGGLSFDRFEEVLRNWPDEAPGIQCIWNQYAECVLQTRKFDFVKELMERWFCSVRKAENCHHEGLQGSSSDDTNAVLQSASASDLCAWFSGYNQTDRVYGMLNLSLYKVLQNDYANALFALNQALKAASADNYCHCLRELTMFLLTNSIKQDKEAYMNHILTTVKVHMADARAWVAAEPFSRSFIQKIGRPRVRQLVSKMLRPVSANFSLMKMVVEVWHRVLRLPHMHNNITNLVDFVEGVMEIMPANYLLATSVCNMLIKNSTLKDSVSTCFWASSLLVNALFHAVPVAPEYVWVESAEVLFNLTNSRKIGQSFLVKALSVYPFSIKLWKSYLQIFDDAEYGDSVRAAAREKGIMLD